VDYKWDAQSTLAMQMPVGYVCVMQSLRHSAQHAHGGGEERLALCIEIGLSHMALIGGVQGYAEGLMWGATGLVVVAGLVYTARAALARKAKTD
jgi:hypothetical protein